MLIIIYINNYIHYRERRERGRERAERGEIEGDREGR